MLKKEFILQVLIDVAINQLQDKAEEKSKEKNTIFIDFEPLILYTILRV